MVVNDIVSEIPVLGNMQGAFQMKTWSLISVSTVFWGRQNDPVKVNITVTEAI